ncbi:gliding motility-associated peptidyl-prolyl isomerase GldI [Flavobacterium sp. NRK F10]|uniref:gliding motility-associated peptidyl-prolyl isomerase GldI n=1 Tax=Flavobacterium sp. NRK F10 TaxID=2954931 RepID=UPI0020907307|nr:gliding motility-associated peptidyl-prolyl isomerase GldI [Flavobacterium sp. NRK F10]MCO6175690.1 gliding motility-associated peptidyl-prolyl isomerase GldI [Flavobacterium sp. NRK F10]
MKIILKSIALGFLVAACSQQQARKPISHTDGTFIKESIERNKKLIANEEKLIEDIIKKDTLKEYLASSKGYWYKYDVKVTDATPSPQRGDIAFFDYEIKDIRNQIIYSEEELKPQKYYVDKEHIMMGLRDGIKLMKKGEKITFLFPSHMGYGYHGDDNKIQSNQPLICTVTLNDIQKDTIH